MRSGRFVQLAEGYRGFHPTPLPPSAPPLHFDADPIHVLTEADLSIVDDRNLSVFKYS
jgi:hypothetical protein